MLRRPSVSQPALPSRPRTLRHTSHHAASSHQAERRRRVHQGSRRLDQGTPEEGQDQPARPHHPDDPQARHRAARWRLDLLGDQGRDPGAREADRYRTVPRQGRHRSLPPGDGAEAHSGGAAADARVPGLALSDGQRRSGRSRQARQRGHCRDAGAAAQGTARTRAAVKRHPGRRAELHIAIRKSDLREIRPAHCRSAAWCRSWPQPAAGSVHPARCRSAPGFRRASPRGSRAQTPPR